MNTPNNKRRQRSREAIEAAFIELLQTQELTRITVSDICKATSLNRSTFYANYQDVYDLADTIRDRLFQEVNALYENDIVNQFHSGNYLRLFCHIRDNQALYLTYFKLGYDHTQQLNLSCLNHENRIFPAESMDYHIAFFKAGFNAIVKKWLESGCKESPEHMGEILRSEYAGRS